MVLVSKQLGVLVFTHVAWLQLQLCESIGSLVESFMT